MSLISPSNLMAGVSTYRYKVDFRPSTVIPDVDLKLPK